MSENRQFVVRVLDVAQGVGALVQVDDQPPRWLSKDDLIAVSTTEPPVPPADVLLLKAQEDLERRDEQVGRAMTLLRRVWDESGEGTGVVCRQTGANHWSDVVRWVSDSPEVAELHAAQQAQFDQAGRTIKPEVPPPNPSQEVGRWAAFDGYEVDELYYGLVEAESEDPSPDSNSRRRRLINELAGEAKRRYKPAATDAQLAGVLYGAMTGDLKGAVEISETNPELSRKGDAPERWSGWSDEELDRLGQMLGDGGHELADLRAEVRRRHEADDGLSDAERRAVEVLARNWPDHPVHGTWRAGCMVAWLKVAGIVLTLKEGE